LIVELTKSFIEGGLVLPPGKQRLEACDAICPGLLVEKRATEGAVPVFYLRYKRDGQTKYDRLGTVRELTISQARKLATQKKVEHQQEAKAMPASPAKGEMTLDTFWSDHYLPHAKLHKRSWKRDEQLYRIRIAGKFGDKALSSISRYEVEKFQADLLACGLSHASASHHAKLMRRMLSLATQWEMLEKNVLKGIPLVLSLIDNQVEHYLDEDQLKRLVEVLKVDACRTPAMILLFLLSTGARLNEALTATWKNINVEAGVWKVDAIRAKGKRARNIPLNDSAKWVLEQLESKGKSALLFPSPVKKDGQDVPYTTITRTWYRIRKLAGISANVRIHDLRHSFLSLLARKGASLSMIQMIAGHADPRVTTRYIHLSQSTLGEVANLASVIVPKPNPSATSLESAEGVVTQSDAVATAEKETPASNIVSIFKRAA
jgi:integrase